MATKTDQKVSKGSKSVVKTKDEKATKKGGSRYHGRSQATTRAASVWEAPPIWFEGPLGDNASFLCAEER